MGTFIIIAAIWLIPAFFFLFFTWDSEPYNRWLEAKKGYKVQPSENNKKRLAICAERYVKQRRRGHYVYLWPISLPYVIIRLLLKAPRRIYLYFKNNESAYAQAKMHMRGEI